VFSRRWSRSLLLLVLGLFVLSIVSSVQVHAADNLKGSVDDPYVSPERKQFIKKKPYEGTTIDIMAPSAIIADPLYPLADTWSKMTGGEVNITEVPLSSFHQKIFTDLVTGMAQYDAYLTAAWFYGDYFKGPRDYIVPIKQFMDDPKHPYWCQSCVPAAIEQLLKWNGNWYGVHFDNDGQAFYYRKDILTKEKYRDRFEDEFGYRYQVPPRDHQEIIDIAQFFNGWDWDNDGSKDNGFTGHFKVGGQGMFHFMTWAAPYVIQPDNKFFWFNPDTMEPLISSPGHLKSLRDLQKLVDAGPEAMMAWTLGESWNHFKKGDAVLTFTWGDLGTQAQNEEASNVKGKLGVSTLPGVEKAYDPIDSEWNEFDKANVVGNNIGGSWHGVIARHSPNKEATYDFLAWAARPDNQFWMQTEGWTGVDIGSSFVVLEEYGGSASIEDYKEAGWSENDAREMSKGYYGNLTQDQFFNLLRIPGANEYARAVDVTISSVLTGDIEAKAGLNKLKRRFNAITERQGIENQKKQYEAMLQE